MSHNTAPLWMGLHTWRV